MRRSHLLRLALAPVAPLAVFVGCASRTPEAPAGKPAARIAVDASAADPAAAAPPVASLEPEALCRGNTTLADAERGHRDWQAQLAELVKDGQEPQGPEEYRVHSKDRCGVAKNNVDASMKAILAAPAPKARAATVRAGWDRRTPPKYMDLVQRRLRLSPAESALLAKNGFMASDRLEVDSYGSAFHDVFQSELPLFVSMDALLHAVYAAHDGLLADLEAGRLKPALEELLGKLACALPEAAKGWPTETAHDVDLWLTVARMLSSQADASVFGEVTEQAKELAGLADAATEMRGVGGEGAIVLFGRPRVMDFTQYQPRAHYATRPDLQGYFRTSMWLSRVEANLVSRSSKSSHPSAAPDPGETPREDLAALAIAELVERAGAMPQYDVLEGAWALLAGKREDVGVRELLALRKKANIESLRDPGAPAALRAAIGKDFARTARTHPMPEGATELPAIATLLGPRVPGDTTALRSLVNDRISGRYMVTPADMGYALGHDRAKAWLAADLARFPALGAGLDEARRAVAAPSPTRDLYSAWFDAVRAVAAPPGPGALPSFARTEAWADAKVNTALVGFGQIRHNHVLVAAQGYDAWGCEIPEAYVEPAPAVLDALAAYADRGAAAIAALDPLDMGHGKEHFARLGLTVRVLRRIVERELSGEPLTAEENRFLGFVAEYLPYDPDCIDSCAPPHYSGWWFDLFPKRKDGLLDPVFVADYYTSQTLGQAAYLGAKKPVYGVFVVDQGGAPRVFVGPVARGFGQPGTLSPRLVDADVPKLPKHDAPWLASWVAPSPAEPPLLVTETERPRASRRPWDGGPDGSATARRAPPPPAWELSLRSTRDLGPVTVTLLDHHRRPMASQTQRVGAQAVRFRFPVAKATDEATGVAVRVGGADFVWVPAQEKAIGRGLSFGLGELAAEVKDPNEDGG